MKSAAEESAERSTIKGEDIMAVEIFDKIAASVSKTAKSVSDGAKVLADKNRVRKDIATMENELRNRFRDIGEQYYFEAIDEPPANYAEAFAAITELRTSLTAKQRELSTLEGTVTCTECGRTLVKDARFCPYCGAATPEPVQPEPVQMATYCNICGAQLAPDAVFCAACGNRVDAPAPEKGREEAPTPETAKEEAPAPLYCPSCGEPLPPDALFCAACGTKAPNVE